jgi:hypothetical protein
LTILDAIGKPPIVQLRSCLPANGAEALRLAERLGPDAVVVTLAVDSGFKYMTASPLAEL